MNAILKEFFFRTLVYSQLSLNGCLYKIDTLLEWRPRIGPCLCSLSTRQTSLRQRHSARERWLHSLGNVHVNSPGTLQEIIFLPSKLLHSLDTLSKTVKPVLSEHRIKRTVAEVPKFISLIYFLNETFIKRTPVLSGSGHLKSTWNGHFYCCQPVLNGHL